MKTIYTISLSALLSLGLMSSAFAYEDQAKMEKRFRRLV